MQVFKMKTISVGAELISLEQARNHLKVDTYGSPEISDDDDFITVLITAARERIEGLLNLSVVSKVVEIAFDNFNSEMSLYGPIQELTSVKYIDELEAEQTLDSVVYTLDEYAKVPKLVLSYRQYWPKSYNVINAVKVLAKVGFTDGLSPDDNPCPKAIIQAMLLTIGHLYKNRESTTDQNLKELPEGIVSLIYHHRVNLGM